MAISKISFTLRLKSTNKGDHCFHCHSCSTNLCVLSVDDVFLPIQEPVGDLVYSRVGHDGDDLLDLFLGALSSALVQINVGLLQHDVGISATDTLDGSHGEHHLPFAIDVRAENTKNVLELLRDYERLEYYKKGQFQCDRNVSTSEYLMITYPQFER